MELRHSIHHPVRGWGAARRTSRLVLATLVSVVIAGFVSNHVLRHPDLVSAHRGMSIWDRRDSALYVVSTLNLVRARGGDPLTRILVHRYPVARYAVYADQEANDLFFIEPKLRDGSAVGAFAYQLGWSSPRSVSESLSALHVRSAPVNVCTAFRHDRKQLIGSFSSTVPL